MLTDDVPQCNYIVKARGWQAKGCRLQTASAVVKELEGFDNMATNEYARVGCSFCLGTVGGKQPLRTGAADAIETGGIRQCSFVVTAVLGSHHHCSRPFHRLQFLAGVTSLPAVVGCQNCCR